MRKHLLKIFYICEIFIIMQKIFSKNFVKSVFVKKSVQLFQIAKTFIIFFAYLLRKSKKFSNIKKNFFEDFHIKTKIVTRFSCTVKN